MAHDEPVILRTSDGEEYIIGAIEDFQREVVMRASPALMRLLDERAGEPANVSLDALHPRLPDPDFLLPAAGQMMFGQEIDSSHACRS